MTTESTQPAGMDVTEIVIGAKDNGIVLLVIDSPEGRTFDLEPVGVADIIDEGMGAIRLDRDLAAALATELFTLLTDR